MRALIGERSPREVFSWKSPRAKALKLTEDSDVTDEHLFELMLENPYLIRRPLIVTGDELIVGFDRERLNQALG